MSWLIPTRHPVLGEPYQPRVEEPTARKRKTLRGKLENLSKIMDFMNRVKAAYVVEVAEEIKMQPDSARRLLRELEVQGRLKCHKMTSDKMGQPPAVWKVVSR